MMTITDTGEIRREARLTELLDSGVPLGAAEIEDLLAEDPEAREALEEARRARELLAELAPKAAPRDFLRKVQRQIRRRSGGRYFHPASGAISYRISVEVFVVIAVAVMSACWFFLEAARPALPGPLVEEPVLVAPPEAKGPQDPGGLP